jgi:hypothetical protein
MALALILFDLMGLAGYALTIFLGFRAGEPAAVALHVALAIPTMGFVLFGQSMTMFFFIGMGKQAREEAAKISPELEGRMREAVRAQKGPVFRNATWACLLGIVVFVLGAAVHTKAVGSRWHLAAAVLAVLFHLRAMWAALVGMSDLNDWLADPASVAKAADAPTQSAAT